MSAFRILVVDDESAVLDALASTLRSQLIGAVVDTAATADAALKQLAQTNYNAVVSDIRMPDMDGLTLLKEIRAISPATPTILITGVDDNDLAVQALRLGAYDYIRKPLEIDYLLASLNRAIQMRQLSLKVEGQQVDLERHGVRAGFQQFWHLRDAQAPSQSHLAVIALVHYADPTVHGSLRGKTQAIGGAKVRHV